MSLEAKVEEMDPETQIIMRQVADEAATKAVNDTLLRLGIDPNNPIEAQRDFAAMREMREMVSNEEWWKDQHHLRRWRKAVDAVESKGFMAAVGFFMIAGAAGLALTISRKFGIGG